MFRTTLEGINILQAGAAGAVPGMRREDGLDDYNTWISNGGLLLEIIQTLDGVDEVVHERQHTGSFTRVGEELILPATDWTINVNLGGDLNEGEYKVRISSVTNPERVLEHEIGGTVTLSESWTSQDSITPNLKVTAYNILDDVEVPPTEPEEYSGEQFGLSSEDGRIATVGIPTDSQAWAYSAWHQRQAGAGNAETILELTGPGVPPNTAHTAIWIGIDGGNLKAYVNYGATELDLGPVDVLEKFWVGATVSNGNLHLQRRAERNDSFQSATAAITQPFTIGTVRRGRSGGGEVGRFISAMARIFDAALTPEQLQEESGSSSVVNTDDLVSATWSGTVTNVTITFDIGYEGSAPPPTPPSLDPGDSILKLGDSTVWGHNSIDGQRVVDYPSKILHAELDEVYNVFSEGVALATTSSLLAGTGFTNPLEALLAASPATVVIYTFGINDSYMISNAQLSSNISSIIELTRAAGKIPIFETPNPTTSNLTTTVNTIRSVCNANSVPVIDQFAHITAQLNGAPVTTMMPDGTHPSQATYYIKGAYEAERLRQIFNLSVPGETRDALVNPFDSRSPWVHPITDAAVYGGTSEELSQIRSGYPIAVNPSTATNNMWCKPVVIGLPSHSLKKVGIYANGVHRATIEIRMPNDAYPSDPPPTWSGSQPPYYSSSGGGDAHMTVWWRDGDGIPYADEFYGVVKVNGFAGFDYLAKAWVRIPLRGHGIGTGGVCPPGGWPEPKPWSLAAEGNFIVPTGSVGWEDVPLTPSGPGEPCGTSGSVRAYGGSSSAGTYTFGDFDGDYPQHAASVALPHRVQKPQAVNQCNVCRWPARRNDCRPYNVNGKLEQGMLFALPWSFNPETAPLSTNGKKVARQWRYHGLIVVDQSSTDNSQTGTFALYCNPYAQTETQIILELRNNGELQYLRERLVLVTNNTAATRHGGGNPRIPFLPEVA